MHECSQIHLPAHCNNIMRARHDKRSGAANGRNSSHLTGRLARKVQDTRLKVASEYWLNTWERTPLHGVYTVNNVIPRSLCQSIVREASSVHFSKNRHKFFPTTDVPLKHLTTSWEKFEPILELDIFPLIKRLYKFDTPKFSIVDIFVVKYKMGQQVELGIHRDGSIISFNILLNSSVEFCGGGTRFPGLTNLTIRGQRGAALIHSGKIKHSGVRITKGQRIILVGFIDVRDNNTLIPPLSRFSLRSLPKDDDYLRALWIGSPFHIRNGRKTEDYDGKLQKNDDMSVYSRGILTCFRTRKHASF